MRVILTKHSLMAMGRVGGSPGASVDLGMKPPFWATERSRASGETRFATMAFDTSANLEEKYYFLMVEMKKSEKKSSYLEFG